MEIQLPNPVVEILVGQIASGKSTYALSKARSGVIIINDDAIVNALHCNEYHLYEKELKPLYKAIENTVLQTAIALRRNVLIDRPNYSRAMRRRYISIAKSLDATVLIVCLPRITNEESAKRRVAADGRGYTYDYWLKAIEYHESLFEKPDDSEGADAVIQL